MDRVAAYIDGFNLYNGMSEANLRHLLWLDVPQLVKNLLQPQQTLASVNYFTARVGRPAASVERQGRLLTALKARGGINIIEGTCVYEDEGCRKCGHTWPRRTEKKTDVGIAVGMLTGVGGYDTALLISGDSDLAPAVSAVSKVAGKRVVNAAPPKRVSKELRSLSAAHFVINEKALREAQLPGIVPTVGSYFVSQPSEWCADPDRPL